MHPQQRFFEFPKTLEAAGDHGYDAIATQLVDFVQSAQNTSTVASPKTQNAVFHDCVAIDAKYVWHPYTQHKLRRRRCRSLAHREFGYMMLTVIGIWTRLVLGGWNTIGHGEPRIASAIARQQRQLDHVIFAGFTHTSATQLAAALIEEIGAPFRRVFYSDNGSTAVEVALKIALQSWINRDAWSEGPKFAI